MKGQVNSIPHPDNDSGDEDGEDADEQDVFNHANSIREIRGQDKNKVGPVGLEPTTNRL